MPNRTSRIRKIDAISPRSHLQRMMLVCATGLAGCNVGVPPSDRAASEETGAERDASAGSGDSPDGAVTRVLDEYVASEPGITNDRTTAGSAIHEPPAAGSLDYRKGIDDQDPEVLAQMRLQDRLHASAQELLRSTMLASDVGFAGIAYEDAGITLYYKGEPSAELIAAIARAAAPVEIRLAAHSRAELLAAQALLESTVERIDNDIQSIAVRDDGAGLEIELMPPAQAAELRAAIERKRGATLIDGEELVAGVALDVPVSVTTAPVAIELLASRENDYSPWNGGGQYETWRGTDLRSSWCTTGFGVRKGGQTYLLTAAHCMTAPDRAFNGHRGGCCSEQIGSVHREDWRKDILLINARGSTLIFDGGVNSNVTKHVRSWGYRVANELLCTSGSRSGVICGHRTASTEHSIRLCDSDGDCFMFEDLAKAVNVNGALVGRPGDSGGPVFSLHGNGVRAKGTISARSDTSILYFQDMDAIVDSMGAVPLVLQ